jgi:cell division septation protein DedD
VKPAPSKTTPPAVAPTPAAAAPVATTPEPSGSGFAIQVAALKEASEADAVVKRLASKGYPAYVVAPAKGSPTMYRVRVGKYKDRREADTVAARLQKEEQFKPWVVR